MAGTVAAKKQGIGVESFNSSVQAIVPKETAETLILGGGDPKANFKGGLELPEQLARDGQAYSECRAVEDGKAGRIFSHDNVAVVDWAGQKPGEPAHLDLMKAPFWTWFYDSHILKGEHELSALSAGVIAITSDNRIPIHMRSEKVALGAGKLSIPASFVSKKPKGEEFALSSVLPDVLQKNIASQPAREPTFIGLFKDNSFSRNNILALFAVRMDLTAEELSAKLPSAQYAKKIEHLEFVENSESSLSSYITENLDRMMPHTALALLAYGYVRWGGDWVGEVDTSLRRRNFFEMFPQ